MIRREKIPQWAISKSGEVISEKFIKWIASTKKKLIKSFPKAERLFCRIVDKMTARLRKKWRRGLHYTRQKYFIVSDGIVFFGDFYFRNFKLLVEIDGASHRGDDAKEKDAWRTKLIEAWKVTVVRITNTELETIDFRHIEDWLINQLYQAGNRKVGNILLKDYLQMKIKNHHIYDS